MSGTWNPGPGATNGADTFTGGTGNDTASALDGADRMLGMDGNDRLDGGTGNDTIFGGNGVDTILGNDGADALSGGAGNDSINAGTGNDSIFFTAGDGADTITGGTGSDTVFYYSEGGAAQTTTLSGGLTRYTLPDGSSFVVDFTVNNVVQSATPLPCFAAGTRIATAKGEVAVEELRAGDLVVSPGLTGDRLRPVKWIGHSRIDVQRHPKPEDVAPILILAGALADGVPFRDLRVSPEHAIRIDDHLIPARYLVNSTTIVAEAWTRSVTYFHVELDEHALLIAEGAQAESYFDDGNRAFFDNHAVTALAKDMEVGRAGGVYDEAACLPILRHGPALDRILARLELRAEVVEVRGRRAGQSY